MPKEGLFSRDVCQVIPRLLILRYLGEHLQYLSNLVNRGMNYETEEIHFYRSVRGKVSLIRQLVPK